MDNCLQQIWPQWTPVEELGRGSFGVVYKAVRNDTRVQTTAAIKVIAVPQDKSEHKALISEGMTAQETKTYFKGIVDDFVEEVALMESFKGMQNIVSIEDYQVVENPETDGWLILVRMELLTPFNDYIVEHPMSEEDVIRFGIDICTALDICGRRNIIHRDIKPENVFVNDFGFFKLGDFGIAKRFENMAASHSQKGTFNYMAPEVANGTHYDARVDIYSLGIVLYRLMNQNYLPFITAENRMNPNERRRALERRLNGEVLPAPSDASEAMANVILRACAFKPEGRFNTAADFKKALEEVKAGTYVIVPLAGPISEEPIPEEDALEKTVSIKDVEESTTSIRSKKQKIADPNATVAVHDQKKTEKPIVTPKIEQQVSEKEKTQKNGKKWLLIALAVLVLAIGIALFFLLRNCGPGPEPIVTEEPTQENPSRDNPVVDGLQRLQVESLPTKLFYHVGDSFVPDGLSLTAVFADGSSQTIREGYTYEPELLEKGGTQEIKVFFGGKETKLDVVVSTATLVSLEIKTLPKKLDYFMGQSVDLTGLEMLATYSDGTTELITEGFETLTGVFTSSGDNEITFSYNGVEQSFHVHVDAISLSGLEIVSKPDKSQYYVGDTLDLSGLQLKASYSNGLEEELKEGYSVSPEKLDTAGTQTVTVTFGNQAATFEVEVSGVQVESISIVRQPGKKDYFTGDGLDLGGLVIKAHFNNGTEEEISNGISGSPSVLNTAGTQKITVSYGGKNDYYEVQVREPVLDSIRVQTNPTKMAYTVGEAFSSNGLSLLATYNNGKTETVTSGFSCSPTNLNTVGNQTITVSWNGKTTSLQVAVQEVVLSSIAVATNPNKTSYFVGDNLDTTGLTLSATYSNGTKETVSSGFTCAPTALNTAGTQKVIVSYKGLTASFDVTVQEKVISSISVKTNPTKMSYFVGETLDTTGLTINVAYNNGENATVSSGFSCSPTALNTAGNQSITVTYQGKTTTLQVSVQAVELSTITVATNPNKVNYFVGDTLDMTGLTLTASYNNGKNETVTSGFTCSPTSLNTAGNQIISVSWSGKKTTIQVLVQAITLESISVKTIPAKQYYYVGDTIDTGGLSLIATYNNGESETVLAGFDCSPSELTTAGNQTVEVSYGGKKTWFSVSVAEIIVSSISIESVPAKTQYMVGETLDTTGLVLTATYNNGKTESIVNGYEVNQNILSSSGTIAVIVEYAGKTDTFSVNVKYPALNVGDVIFFGPYQWIVIDKKGSNVMLITKEAIASYRTTINEDHMWETWALRTWLNSTFLDRFSETDKAKILTTTIMNQIHPNYHSAYGDDHDDNPTSDRVFLLSYQEALTYFNSDSARLCYPGAEAQGVSIFGTGTCYWLLRTRFGGRYGDYRSVVGFNGHVSEYGLSTNAGIGIRPALWANLGS